MHYTWHAKTQIIGAVAAGLVVAVLGYLLYGSIDWLTAASVALGVGLGLGFQSRRNARRESEDAPTEPEQPTNDGERT